jgi:hypothetical protein
MFTGYLPVRNADGVRLSRLQQQPKTERRPVIPRPRGSWRCWALVMWLLAAGIAGAAEYDFQRQTIQIPTTNALGAARRQVLFADIDRDRLEDLVVVGPHENRVWIYRQRASGFPEQPDQAIELPPQTGWTGLADVDGEAGLELLVSTARGVVYRRQAAGVFEGQWRELAAVSQVFGLSSNDIVPTLLLLDSPAGVGPRAKSARAAGSNPATNRPVPVITSAEAILYQRNERFEWSPGRAQPLQVTHESWGQERGNWAAGPNPARTLFTSRACQSEPGPSSEKKAELDGLRRLSQELEKEARSFVRQAEIDVDGDGQRDGVLWRVAGELDPKTDVFLFLRGADHRLPSEPTQVLHGRGFPVQVGRQHRVCPFCDLDGDGVSELVLLTLKQPVTSPDGLVEAFMTRGFDWLLTIRRRRPDGYPRGVDASVSLTTTLSFERFVSDSIIIDGDFNGDGRPDILAQRSPTQWDVVLSAGGGWFNAKPARAFELPADGVLTIRDLNGDGASDLVVETPGEAQMLVFLSQAVRK